MSKSLIFFISFMIFADYARSNEDIHDRGEYESCEISYHIRLQPGRNVDEGPYRKQFAACVRNLSDCHRRGESLAREHASRMDQSNEGTKPDLGSLNVGSMHIDGHCRELD